MIVLRRVVAGILLILLVVSPPLLLASTIGNPVSAWSALVVGDISDAVVIDVLAAAVWLAWANFAVCVLAEVAALARGFKRPRLVGVIPGSQQLAHALVVTAFVSLPTAGHALASAPAPPVSAAPVAATSLHPPSPRPDSIARPAGSIDVIDADGPNSWWALAETFLGDGQRWREIWTLNVGEQQADGAVLRSPGLIKVGWSIRLPATIAAPMTPSNEDGGSRLPALGFAAGGGLLAGVMLREMLFWRRTRLRCRRPGRTLAPVPTALAPMAKALLSYGQAPMSSAEWLNAALRELAETVAGHGQNVPEFIAARISDEVLELIMGERPAGRLPTVPPPWRVDPATGRWCRLRGDPLPEKAPEWRPFAAFPALVSLGRDITTGEGHLWMLDLEQVAVLSLLGDHQRGLDLARYMAAELASNFWSDAPQITLIGFGAEITSLNGGVLTQPDDASAALQSLLQQLRHRRTRLTELGLDSALEGRARNLEADTWIPHILMINKTYLEPAPTASTVLDELRQDLESDPRRSGITLVLIGETPGTHSPAHQILLDREGRFAFAGQTLVAQQLPADESALLAQTLASQTNTQDMPMPAARGLEAWDDLTDAAGAPRTPAHATEPTASASLFRQPISTVIAESATTMQDVEQLAPPAGQPRHDDVTRADPELDADLAEWSDPRSPRPRLTLLGPVLIRAQGSLPQPRPRVAWHTEVVIYLTAHPRGVNAERLGTDLWPQDPDIINKPKLRQTVYEVRRWLGPNPATGRDHVPTVSANASTPAGLYRVEGLLTDADLFRRLRLRGSTRGPEGIEDLEAALSLVTGPPLDQRRADGYTWLIDTPVDVEYQAMIVDVAHIVATHHLANGQPQRAAHVARIALAAGSLEDVPLLDLVAAADAQGHDAEAAALVRQILGNYNAEVEEDLPPRTAEVLRRRQWLA